MPIAYEYEGHRYQGRLRDPIRSMGDPRVWLSRLKIQRDGKPVERDPDPTFDRLTEAVMDGPEVVEPDKIRITRVPRALSSEELTAAAAEFAAHKAATKAAVDAQAEFARQQFVTPGDAQQAVYLAKKAEAEAMASDGAPQAGNYPLLAMEIGITAATLAEVGASVRAQAAAWIQVAAAIEGLRLSAKKAIDDATTYEVVDAEASDIAWPAAE